MIKSCLTGALNKCTSVTKQDLHLLCLCSLSLYLSIDSRGLVEPASLHQGKNRSTLLQLLKPPPPPRRLPGSLSPLAGGLVHYFE